MNNHQKPIDSDLLSIACSTLGFRELELPEAISRIINCGILNIEICHVPGFCEHLASIDQEEIGKVKKALGDTNARIFALTVYPGYLNDPFPEEVKKKIGQFAQLALAFGAKYMTIPSGQMVDDDDRERSYRFIAGSVADIADQWIAQGLTISIEAPHWRTLTEDLAESADFVKMLPDKVMSTIDTSHVCRGEKQNLAGFLDKFGLERVAYFHLRDVYGKDISLTPGLGHIDFPAFIRYLKSNQKKATLSIELEDERLSPAAIERQIKKARMYIGSLIQEGQGSRPINADSRFIKFVNRSKLGLKPELRRHPRLMRSFPIKVLKKVKGLFKGKPQAVFFDGKWSRKKVDLNLPLDFRNIKCVELKQKPDKHIKVCVVGSGGAGTFHAYGYSRLKGVVVKGVSDIDREAAENLAFQTGANPYRSLRKMVESENPDIVSVCTREWQHFDALDYLVDRNCAIFGEKIFTSRLDQALEIRKRIAERKVFFGINYNYRFKPGIQKIKEIIDTKAFGDLVSLHIKVHAFSYHHALDLAWHLGGKIRSIKASYFNDDKIRDFGGTDWKLFDKDILYVPSRNIAVIMEMESQVLVTIESSYFYRTQEFILGIDATFTDGAVSLKGLNAVDVVGELTFVSKKNNKIDLALKRKDFFDTGYNYTFSRSIESFVNAFVAGKSPETGIKEAIFNMKLEKAIGRAFSREGEGLSQ